MNRPAKYSVGACMCEHEAHCGEGPATGCHNHIYGAQLVLTHWVRQISGAVCATCAVGILGAFPDEVTEL